MKQIAIIIGIFCGILSQAQTQAKFKKYPFKSGIVQYEWEGTTTGSQTLYFDDYGWRESKMVHTTTKIMGVSAESHNLTIMHGATQYEINMKDKSGSKMENMVLSRLNEGADYEEVAQKTLIGINYKKIGQETICGKLCDVYEGLGKIWVWKGVMLKSSTANMGINATVTATSVKTDILVSEEKFVIPDDVKIIEPSYNNYFEQE